MVPRCLAYVMLKNNVSPTLHFKSYVVLRANVILIISLLIIVDSSPEQLFPVHAYDFIICFLTRTSRNQILKKCRVDCNIQLCYVILYARFLNI